MNNYKLYRYCLLHYTIHCSMVLPAVKAGFWQGAYIRTCSCPKTIHDVGDQMSFNGKFQAKLHRGKAVCVELDTDSESLPLAHLNMSEYDIHAITHSLGKRWRESTATATMRFNERIINVTYDLVCAYKLNLAFYERLGWNGMRALERTIEYIRCVDPTIPVICDAHRGEDEDSNTYYAEYAFDILNADAIVVSQRIDKRVLDTLSKYACNEKTIIVRRNLQRGGDLRGAVLFGLNYPKGHNLIFGSSRDVIHASSNANFETVARTAVVGMQAQIDSAVQDVLV